MVRIYDFLHSRQANQVAVSTVDKQVFLKFPDNYLIARRAKRSKIYAVVKV